VLADPNLEAGVRQALERILRRKRMAELRAANQEQLASGELPSKIALHAVGVENCHQELHLSDPFQGRMFKRGKDNNG